MPRTSIATPLSRISALALEMQKFVPPGTRGADGFRAELAGLLVVSIAAAYEECVKKTLVEHASKRHIDFEEYAERSYSKLSSRVRLNNLYAYAKLFGPKVEVRFKDELNSKKKRISDRMGKNIVKRYEQILDWRHDYAHEGIKHTTIDEALEFHMYGVRVIYCFNNAFDC